MFQNFSGWKILKIFLIFSLLFIGAVFAFVSYQDKFNSDINKAKAAANALSGWAWSSNIGWVSLNCEDSGVCASSNYQVVLDPVSGALNGYAWSSNIGWIKFDSTGPYPPAGPDYSARIDLTNKSITGWMRACSVFQANCGGVLKDNSERGGWDGWIKFTDAEVVNNQIRSINNPVYGGWAWGGDVVGWLSFGGSTQGGGDGSWGGPGSGGDVRVPSFLTVSCSSDKTKAVIGEPIIWTATVNGGTPDFIYLWTDNEGFSQTNISAERVNLITTKYLTKGIKRVSVGVTDRNFVSANAQCSLGGATGVNIGGTIKEIQPR